MQRDADDPRSLLAWLELNFSDWYSQLEVQSKNPNAFLFNIQFLLLFALNFFRSFLYQYLRVIHFRIANVCFVARRAQQAQCPLPAGHSTKSVAGRRLLQARLQLAGPPREHTADYLFARSTKVPLTVRPRRCSLSRGPSLRTSLRRACLGGGPSAGGCGVRPSSEARGRGRG